MKLEDVITTVKELKPNQYDWGQYVKWINQIEGRIYHEVFEKHEDSPYYEKYYEDDAEIELLVPEPYSNIYELYVYSMIDYHNQELDQYTNSSMMFNEAYQEFSNYWHRTHASKTTPLRF